MHWHANLRPGLPTAAQRRKKWTKAEELKLLDIVGQHSGCDWVAIAADMGNLRPPFDYFQRYQTALQPTYVRTRPACWPTRRDRVGDGCMHFARS